MPHLLYNNIGKGFGFGKANPYDFTANSSSYGIGSSTGSILVYLATIGIILTIILFLIHYTLYPIFSLQPGDPGIIPVPGFADNQAFWKPTGSITTFTDLSDIATKVQMNTYNYSFTLDISIQDPYISLNKGYSVIFSRGGTVNPSPQANSSIKGSINNYNVAIALAPGNTDLVVSVLNSDGNPDNILIPNIPVQTPFRVGVVIMSTVFEVYLNGKLVSTRKLTSGATGNYTGPFRAPVGNVARAVRVGNLLVWNRVASPGNIRYAKPPLMSPIDKDAISSGGSCVSGNLFSDSTSFIDTLSKKANEITTSATATLGATATAASDAVSDFSE
jgi:hypothetical protein